MVEQQVEARGECSLVQVEGATAELDDGAGEKGHGPDSDKLALLNNSDRPVLWDDDYRMIPMGGSDGHGFYCGTDRLVLWGGSDHQTPGVQT